ncbi:hypothetical protein [Tsukamurella tyrosinosolvens]|uniref:hypothetical protein n=1 Tax=Tsukamurella tyrosinosolvens TaxID=57704 RepID=UPI002DD43F9B|nr:hypothetical protein [Tsukamurella tyrosinosolvens]MEC4616206.1 hypothetical protein [Tsukamurella tyrosinosolvens]
MTSNYAAHLAHIERAAVVLDELKTTAGCVDCGFNLWPEALHFDHIDPHTKLASLGWVRDRSMLKSRRKLSRYLDHVSKYCVIRCANCHAHRTHQERQWTVRRGIATVDLADTLF